MYVGNIIKVIALIMKQNRANVQSGLAYGLWIFADGPC